MHKSQLQKKWPLWLVLQSQISEWFGLSSTCILTEYRSDVYKGVWHLLSDDPPPSRCPRHPADWRWSWLRSLAAQLKHVFCPPQKSWWAPDLQQEASSARERPESLYLLRAPGSPVRRPGWRDTAPHTGDSGELHRGTSHEVQTTRERS